MMKKIGILTVAILLLSSQLSAQVIVPGTYQTDYFQMLLLTNQKHDRPISIYPSIYNYYDLDSLTWDVWSEQEAFVQPQGEKYFQVWSPSVKLDYNEKYPMGFNDGPIWTGKGMNGSVQVGVSGRYKLLHFTFAPVVYSGQNLAYRIDAGPYGKNEFQYPFEKNIDWVFRYGNGAFTKFHLGQSEIRLIYKKATIGISTQNMNWGPSMNNGLLMTKNAGGFPHVDMGTAAPIQTKIGDIEFKSYWGALQESDYFDQNPDNNWRYFAGVSFGYRPKWIEGLNFGINRAMYRLPFNNDFSAKDLVTHLATKLVEVKEYQNVNGSFTNDFYDQTMSIFLHWTFPDHGFEMYVDFARNDFPGTVGDFFDQPDRSRAYNLGMSKVLQFKNGTAFKIWYEHTTLGSNKTSLVSASPTFYVHSIIEQGYTNDGQLIGPSVGPGSNADLLRVDFYHQKGKIGAFYHRNRLNDDYFFGVFNVFGEDFPHDIVHTININGVQFLGNFALEANLALALRKNWYYDDDVFTFGSLQTSVQLTYLLK